MAARPKRMARRAPSAVFAGGEIDAAFVDIGREDFDIESAGFGDEDAELGGVAHVVGHHRAEEFDGIIGFEQAVW